MARDASIVSAADIAALVAEPGGIAFAAQPIVDLRRGTVTGYELLARVVLPGDRHMPPEHVFAAASVSGYGAELEAAVLGRALEVSRSRPANCFVALNVDPLNLDDPPVRRVLDRHGDLGGFVFELGANAEIHDLDAARETVDRLRRRGATIAIDATTASHASLEAILGLKPQLVKLDRELVIDVHTNEATRTLVRMLGEVADRVDAWVLAEGVETQLEAQALVELGVPLGQGYFFGAPAAPWSRLDVQATTALERARKLQSPTIPGGRVGAFVEPASVCSGQEDWPRGARVGVRVDGAARPIEMRVVGEEGPRLRLEYDLLRVNVETGIAEAAVRAMARPERLRWDPIVCIDELGKLEGVLSLQRVLSILANAALTDDEPEPPPSSETRH